MATLDSIRAIKDPERRAIEAQGFVVRGIKALADAREVRDQAVADLRVAGWTMRRIATLLDLSPAQVLKIDRSQGLVSERRVRRR